MLGYQQKEKPSAAEQMVAKLLGFTPEQMQETLVGFRDTIVRVGETLARVEAKQDAILSRLEAVENVRIGHDAS